jgi:iron complex outermembrane receptor protein
VRAFADTTGIQVSYDAARLRGLRSPGVSGTYTSEEALQKLLAGTGLTYRFTTPSTVTLERAEAQSAESGAIELSPITVVGQFDTGYRSERAISASRTAAETRDLPQTIQVLPPEVIEDQSGHRVGDVLRFVPGLTALGETGNRFRDNFNIRGFGQNFVKNGLRRAGGATAGRSNPQDIASIERLEILKGPSSVLYGNFEPSGMINVVTKQPLREFFAAVEATAGSFDFKRLSGDVSGPLYRDGVVRFRLNAAYEDRKSFKDFFTQEHIFVAPVVAVEFGPNTLLTLEGEYTRDDFLFAEGIPAAGFFLPNPHGKLRTSFWPGEPELEGDLIEASDLGYRFEHRFTDWLVVRHAFRWERFKRIEDSVIPDGLEPDQHTLNRSFLRDAGGVNNEYLFQTDVVTRFPTGPIAHELLVGFDYRDRTFDSCSLFLAVAPIDIFNPVYGQATKPSGPFNTFTANEDALGFYVQNRVTLWSNVKLLGGLRYDISQQDQVFVSGATGARTPSKREDKALATQVGLVYQPVKPVSLYFNRTESFLPQFGTTQGGQPFDPETGVQYEVGTKVDVLDGRLSANLALFQITKQNVQTPDPDDPQFSRAIGEQRSRSLEAFIAGELLPGWRLLASYAFTDTEITHDFGGLQGKALANVAAHTASLLTRYDLRRGVFDGLGASLGVTYVGTRQGDDENSFELPAYVRTDIGLHYGPSQHVKVDFFVENVFDEAYVLSSFSIDRTFPGAPRTFIGRLKVLF